MGAAVASGDLTDDGREGFVVISTQGVVYAYDVFQQSQIWQSTTHEGTGSDIAVMDLDGDGQLEMIFGTQRGMYLTR